MQTAHSITVLMIVFAKSRSPLFSSYYN